MEYEIVEIENMLKNVVLIDEDNINTDMVNIGTTVRVRMTAASSRRINPALARIRLNVSVFSSSEEAYTLT